MAKPKIEKKLRDEHKLILEYWESLELEGSEAVKRSHPRGASSVRIASKKPELLWP